MRRCHIVPEHMYIFKVQSFVQSDTDVLGSSLRSQNHLLSRFSGIQLGDSEWPANKSLLCLSQASTAVILLGWLTCRIHQKGTCRPEQSH